MTGKKIRSQNPRDKSFIVVVDRVFSVLETFSVTRRSGLTLDEITQHTRLAKTTVHRLLYSLQKCGIVEQTVDTGLYSIGPRFFELSNNALPYQRLIAVSRPFMQSLMFTFGESVNLGVYEDGKATQIYSVESAKPFRVAATVGEHVPLHTSSMAKAIAAYLPPQEVEKALLKQGLPQKTRNSIASREQFSDELDRVRREGVAHDNQEDTEGVICVGAPIFSHGHQIQGAVSISGPAVRMVKQIPALEVGVKECAARISAFLGFSQKGPDAASIQSTTTESMVGPPHAGGDAADLDSLQSAKP